VTAVRFSRAELERFRNAPLPDLIGPGVRLLFVGVNPSLRAAAVGAPFAGGNRFYPALQAAGIVDRRITIADGMSAADRAHLIDRGIGITGFVDRATPRADEVTRDELVAGAATLEARVARLRPQVVAVLGITAYRIALGRPGATFGPQPETLGGRPLWVLPNPSGRNAHSTLATLAVAYREAALAAGITPISSPTR
jgi:double-stranded uracil-DNA glycosylase